MRHLDWFMREFDHALETGEDVEYKYWCCKSVFSDQSAQRSFPLALAPLQ